MSKDLIRPAKIFGLHGLPMDTRLVRHEANLQTFVALFGGRYASKQMILQRIYLWTPRNGNDPMSSSGNAGCSASHEEIWQDQDGDGPYPVSLMLTKNREPYWYDPVKSEIWRCFSINGDHHVNRLPGMPDMACQAARMLWQYHETLSGLPGAGLRKSNDDFVSTRESLVTLNRVASQDPHQRSADCLPEIQFALNHTHYAPHILPVREEGTEPAHQHRHRHGIHQILPLDSGNGICMADLKMAFTEHYPHRQLGSVRKALSYGKESDPQSDTGDSVIFTARLVEGFLGVIKELLIPNEFNRLTFSGKHLAYELGIRFLCDHLDGDGRFPVDFPGQNLHRARKQFRLAYRIGAHAAELRRMHRDLELT
ncbi:MAG: hypothetical protein RLZZ505_601 [Verrucomicrobiota bacterium]|jgi:hypothetical protein